jgi:hypothetical protein
MNDFIREQLSVESLDGISGGCHGPCHPCIDWPGTNVVEYRVPGSGHGYLNAIGQDWNAIGMALANGQFVPYAYAVPPNGYLQRSAFGPGSGTGTGGGFGNGMGGGPYP